MRKKTDLKLKLSKLMLLGFLDRAIGGWLATLLFGTIGLSYWDLNHQGSKLLRVELLWIGTSGA